MVSRVKAEPAAGGTSGGVGLAPLDWPEVEAWTGPRVGDASGSGGNGTGTAAVSEVVVVVVVVVVNIPIGAGKAGSVGPPMSLINEEKRAFRLAKSGLLAQAKRILSKPVFIRQQPWDTSRRSSKRIFNSFRFCASVGSTSKNSRIYFLLVLRFLL